MLEEPHRMGQTEVNCGQARMRGTLCDRGCFCIQETQSSWLIADKASAAILLVGPGKACCLLLWSGYARSGNA